MSDQALQGRVLSTIRMFHDRGYVPTVTEVESFLLGGSVPRERLVRVVREIPEIFRENGHVCLKGHENLLDKTFRRRQSNHTDSAFYWSIAREFASDLGAYCPFVKTIAVSGSLATGGFSEEDDVDFNIITEEGARYTTYLMANLLGVKYSLKLRGKPTDALHSMPLLPKVICVNVILEECVTRPFRRQDEQMAFELVQSRPIFGVDYFRKLLASNPWLATYFPQEREDGFVHEVDPRHTLVKSALRILLGRPLLLRFVEGIARTVSWILYEYVHWTRRGEPEALERIEFIKRVKHPYEVFQD